MKRPFLFLPIVLLLSACGGEGGSSSAPVKMMAKSTPSGDGQSATVATTLPIALAVRITQDGVPLAGQVVAFLPGGGAGTLLPTHDTTGADGIASTMWTLGTTSGARSVTASSGGVTGSPVLFSATALPGAPVAMVAGAGGGQVQEVNNSFGQSLNARVQDNFGNGVPGVTVAWAITAGAGTLAAPTSVTGADGRATMSLVAGGSPGPLTVKATTSTLPADTVAFVMTVVPTAAVISISSNFFSPMNDTIPVGGAVKWTWVNGQHNVTPVSGPDTFQASPLQSPGATYGPLVFNTPGVYHYECTVHTGMVGTLTVQ